MKKLFIMMLFALPFLASAQHTYISSSGDVILYSGSIEKYDSPDIFVDAQYRTAAGIWIATLSLRPAGASEGFTKTHQIEFDNATIDALTAVGATNTEDIHNCLMQAVEDYLIVLNGAIFTLH